MPGSDQGESAGGSELTRLAEEQAALRRVATLVARQAPQAEIFTAVAEELGRVLGVEDIRMIRYDADADGGVTAAVVASWGKLADTLRIGERHPLGGENVTTRVFRSGRPARLDNYGTASGAIGARVQQGGVRSAVGTPIMVECRLWGAMLAAAVDSGPLPPDTELRLGEFTELLGTAIANVETRDQVRRLADEQAALRRVATLVAEGAPPTDVFEALIAEVAELTDAAQVGLGRYEGSEELSILALCGHDPSVLRAGIRVSQRGDSIAMRVRRTGRSARLDFSEEGSGEIAVLARRSRVQVSVGAPVVVEGALWGLITASWKAHDEPPADAEQRLTKFAELLDTAIANADSRDQLTASRARLLTAGDEARRRVVRDLHDGAQQRLVHTIVTLKLAQRAFAEDPERAASLLGEGLEHAERGNAELREMAHGILPSVLTRGGLRAATASLVSDLDLPVDINVARGRLPPAIEASAYFIVAEGLTNVVKHSQAERAQVAAVLDDGALSVEVRDDGIGGADPEGPGLLGISDRVAALGGRLRIDSPKGGGTVLTAGLWLPS